MITRRSLFRLARSAKSPRRFNSSNAGPSVQAGFSHHQIANSAGRTLGFLGRVLGYSMVGVIGVGLTTFTVYEGMHQYVELSSMAAPKSQDKECDWDLDTLQWSSGLQGGTDPALGLRGQHLVRAAWMVLNWGVGMNEVVVNTNSKGKQTAVLKRVQYAEAFLSEAITEAEQRLAKGAKLRPETLIQLRSIYAGLLESMGTDDSLYEARTQYERVWSSISPTREPILAVRIAYKLGNLNEQVGDAGSAKTWWYHALHLSGALSASHAEASKLSLLPPTSLAPGQQRTAVSTLVSLSSHYATTGQLLQAQTSQEAALSFLRTIPIPSPAELAKESAPQSLHALYILHRSALLSIHHAEVLFALKASKGNKSSVQWLTNAAESSERVIGALTGASTTSDAHEKLEPSKAYTDSPVLKSPAEKLLRGARQSAAESWNLLGVLLEGTDNKRAVECYERALSWTDAGALRKSTETIQRNLNRVKKLLAE